MLFTFFSVVRLRLISAAPPGWTLPRLPDIFEKLGSEPILEARLTPMHAIDVLDSLRGRIFLGSLAAAQDADLLASAGITHIVCLLGAEYEYHRATGRFDYWSHAVPEKESESIGELFAPVAAFVDAALAPAEAPPTKVLFHCRSGEHRSATVLISYLMHRTGKAALEVAKAVQDIRCCISICPPYARALLAHQAALSIAPGASAAPAVAGHSSAVTAAIGGVGGLAPSAVPSIDLAAELDVAALLATDEAAIRARGIAAPPSDAAAFVDNEADAMRIIREIGYEAVAEGLFCKISRIAPRLYLGSEQAAFSREELRAAGITHVVSCLGPESVRFPTWLHYCAFFVGDYPSEADKLLGHVPKAVRFVREALASKPSLPPRPAGGAAPAGEVLSDDDASALLPKETAVLIHCQAGASRSATVMVAFLMHVAGLRARDALRYVQQRRPIARPNEGFRHLLLKWEDELFKGDGIAVHDAVSAVGGAGGMPASGVTSK